METIWRGGGGDALLLLVVGGRAWPSPSHSADFLTPPPPPISPPHLHPTQRPSEALVCNLIVLPLAWICSGFKQDFFFQPPATVLSKAAVSSGSKHNIPTKTLLGHWAQCRRRRSFFFSLSLPAYAWHTAQPLQHQRCISKYAPASFKKLSALECCPCHGKMTPL